MVNNLSVMVDLAIKVLLLGRVSLPTPRLGPISRSDPGGEGRADPDAVCKGL